ncbi:MAG TPA: ABC transporter permease [Ilumatobacteraceae bacterium]|nr:ABC transporter permease [Ilumatobacteraceae bacterium]HUV17719.1 ABC transporter permease [Ilumatobacteraceae bacterium]
MTTVADVDTPRGGVKRPELIGLGALVGAGALLAAIGTRLITGPIAILALSLVLASILMLIVVAVTGTPETRRKIAPYGLLKPGMLWLALFYLAPLFTLLRLSLSTLPSRFAVEAEFDWNFDNYVTAFTDFGPQFQRAFVYAGIATVLTIAIGYPLAYVIAFRGGKYRTLLLGLVVIPFFTSYLIRTIAWRSLLSDNGFAIGFIDAVGLTWFFEAANIMDNGRLINTPAAVIFGLTYNFLPFMILPIYVSLEKIDVRLLDAAKDLYSTSTSAFAKVIVPLSVPGIFAGTLLTFIPAAGDFVNSLYLGSPNTTMIGNSIQDQFLVQNNVPLASAMSFVLMFIITVFVIIYSRFFGTEDLA